VVLLFAGFDRDATELVLKIQEKEREDEQFKEDIFYSNLILLGKCIADADYTSTRLRNQISDDLWSLYQTKESPSLREEAMKIIFLIKPDNIIDSLIRELKDEEDFVRWKAAEALRRIGSEKAVDPLIKTLETDKFNNARWEAAEALGEIGSEKAVDPLIKFLETGENDEVRASAAYALGLIESEKAAEPLIKTLETNEASFVRVWAVWALGEIGSEKAVEPLRSAMKDESEGILGKVKDSAFESLEKISRKSKKRILQSI